MISGRGAGSVSGGDGTGVVVPDQATDVVVAGNDGGGITGGDDAVVAPDQAADVVIAGNGALCVAAVDVARVKTHEPAYKVTVAEPAMHGGVSVAFGDCASVVPDQAANDYGHPKRSLSHSCR